MAQDIRFDYLTATTITIALENIADGASVTGTKVDLGNPSELKLVGELRTRGQASGTGTGSLFAKWSADDARFSGDLNDQLITVIRFNAAVEVIKVFEFDVVAQHLNFRFLNQSGATTDTTAGNHSLKIYPKSIDQA